MREADGLIHMNSPRTPYTVVGQLLRTAYSEKELTPLERKRGPR
jgi:hypothetical protein